MQLFYNPEIDNSISQFSFSSEESKHIIKVLRKKVDDELYITNGKGYIYQARIIDASIKRCKAEIISREKKHKTMHYLHLVVAPTKMNDRFEWFLEKATEIGVNEITPIICEHSERKIIKIERMQKVLQSAMKQSLQAYLPKLNQAIKYTDYLELEKNGLLFIAHCEEGEKMELKRRVAADNDVTVLIGPEGDFSANEIDLALKKGFLPVSLGKNRLRTETAALVACATVAVINNA
ncbi:16S rRNA (uracil(1498)-N(3))-methyltransferase [Aurantibacter crassamenti]|uniref:16S rRNA (uracil(1498)-N(3))-methyltransferase n=1 Tax=Aurantibacter crassamenti TaxID=1837375 RepID=UPI001939CB9A|nr:16S rRNA (uracil(1498)-N(3))-methyltransferase [Aurantibacter crassamenti]MBM1106733.1 16S rRNA (uracil(1498)-N(3))-methyltransferase [Aurantibacter crassamenti]